MAKKLSAFLVAVVILCNIVGLGVYATPSPDNLALTLSLNKNTVSQGEGNILLTVSSPQITNLGALQVKISFDPSKFSTTLNTNDAVLNAFNASGIGGVPSGGYDSSGSINIGLMSTTPLTHTGKLIEIPFTALPGAATGQAEFTAQIEAYQDHQNVDGTYENTNSKATMNIVGSIPSVALTGVTAPVAGAAPVTNAPTLPSGANYSVSAVTWTPADNPFKGSTAYTASVTVTATNNYTFPNNVTATIDGQNATVTKNSDTVITVKREYTTAALTKATAPTVTVAAPPAGTAGYTFTYKNGSTTGITENRAVITMVDGGESMGATLATATTETTKNIAEIFTHIPGFFTAGDQYQLTIYAVGNEVTHTHSDSVEHTFTYQGKNVNTTTLTAKTHTYDGTSKSYALPSATADFPANGWTVQYSPAGQGQWGTVAPTNVGDYDVRFNRDADETYNAVTNHVIANGLRITQANYSGTWISGKGSSNIVAKTTTPITVNVATADLAAPGGGTFGALTIRSAAVTNAGDIIDTNVTLSGNSFTVTPKGVDYIAGKTATVQLTMGSTNYQDFTLTYTFNLINKGAVTFGTIADPSRTYNGEPVARPANPTVTPVGTKAFGQNPKWSYKVIGQNHNGVAVTLSDGSMPTDAGSYTLTYTYEDDHYFGEKHLPFNVNQAVLSSAMATLSGTSFPYSGAAHTPTVKIAGSGKQVITAGTDYEITYSNNIDAGTANATITLAVDSLNWTANGTIIKTFTITPVSVNLSASGVQAANITKTYDGTLTAGSTTDNATYTLTWKDVKGVGTETFDYTLSGPAGFAKYNDRNASTNKTVSIDASSASKAFSSSSGAKESNYTITYPASVTGGVIHKKPITGTLIMVPTSPIAYGTPYQWKFEVTSGLAPSDTIQGAVEYAQSGQTTWSATKPTEPGIYDVRFAMATTPPSSNYDISTATVTGTFTINKADVTFGNTSPSVFGKYGSNVTVDLNKQLVPSVPGTWTIGAVTGTGVKSAKADTGANVVLAMGDTIGDKATVALTFTPTDTARYHVKTAVLNVEVADKTHTAVTVTGLTNKTYDGKAPTVAYSAMPTGANPTEKWNVTVNGATTTYTKAADVSAALKNAGQYTVAFTYEDNDYKGSVTTQVTVAKAPLSVIPADYSLLVGNTAEYNKIFDTTTGLLAKNTYPMIIGGLVNGETLTQGTDYTVSQSGAVDANVAGPITLTAAATSPRTAVLSNYQATFGKGVVTLHATTAPDNTGDSKTAGNGYSDTVSSGGKTIVAYLKAVTGAVHDDLQAKLQSLIDTKTLTGEAKTVAENLLLNAATFDITAYEKPTGGSALLALVNQSVPSQLYFLADDIFGAGSWKDGDLINQLHILGAESGNPIYHFSQTTILAGGRVAVNTQGKTSYYVFSLGGNKVSAPVISVPIVTTPPGSAGTILKGESGKSGGGGGYSSGFVSSVPLTSGFWRTVVSTIEHARPGSLVNINAGSLTTVPTYVMNALRLSGLGMKLTMAGDKTINIPAGKYPPAISGRTYYTYAYLAEFYKGDTVQQPSVSIGQSNKPIAATGGNLYVTAPQTILEAEVPALESATAGVLDPIMGLPTLPEMKPVESTITEAAISGDRESVAEEVENPAKSNGNAWIWMLAVAIAAALGAGGYVWYKKRTEAFAFDEEEE